MKETLGKKEGEKSPTILLGVTVFVFCKCIAFKPFSFKCLHVYIAPILVLTALKIPAQRPLPRAASLDPKKLPPTVSLHFSPSECHDLFSHHRRGPNFLGAGVASPECLWPKHRAGRVPDASRGLAFAFCAVTVHWNRRLVPCRSVVFITIIFNSSRIFHQVDVS